MQRAQYYICNHFKGIRQINKTKHVIYSQNTYWGMPRINKTKNQDKKKSVFLQIFLVKFDQFLCFYLYTE